MTATACSCILEPIRPGVPVVVIVADPTCKHPAHAEVVPA